MELIWNNLILEPNKFLVVGIQVVSEVIQIISLTGLPVPVLDDLMVTVSLYKLQVKDKVRAVATVYLEVTVVLQDTVDQLP